MEEIVKVYLLKQSIRRNDQNKKFKTNKKKNDKANKRCF